MLLTIIFSCLPSPAISSVEEKPKFEIALTFDDAPRGDTPIFSGTQRTELFLQKLKEKRVDQTVFFCNTFDFLPKDAERIKAYSHAGHLIANHTAHHIKKLIPVVEGVDAQFFAPLSAKEQAKLNQLFLSLHKENRDE